MQLTLLVNSTAVNCKFFIPFKISLFFISEMLVYAFITATGCFSLGFLLGRFSVIRLKPQKAQKPETPLSAQLIYYSRWKDRQIEKALTDPID